MKGYLFYLKWLRKPLSRHLLVPLTRRAVCLSLNPLLSAATADAQPALSPSPSAATAEPHARCPDRRPFPPFVASFAGVKASGVLTLSLPFLLCETGTQPYVFGYAEGKRTVCASSISITDLNSVIG